MRLKVKRGKILLLTSDGYVAPPEKPLGYKPQRRPPAKPTKAQQRASIALFAPWAHDARKP
jgi:hypothetical protein